jgi:hypothetical protein
MNSTIAAIATAGLLIAATAASAQQSKTGMSPDAVAGTYSEGRIAFLTAEFGITDA